MDLHHIMRQQLSQLGLSENSYPKDIESWSRFLLEVNKTYVGLEQAPSINERVESSSNVLERVNPAVIEAARLDGKAEITLSILHNISNALNNINVAVNYLLEKHSVSILKQYIATGELLKDHQHNLLDYLTNDTKGKVLGLYLIKLADIARDEEEIFYNELKTLGEQVAHISEIIHTQQTLKRNPAILRPVDLIEVIELSLQVVSPDLIKHNIQVRKNYTELATIFVDKAKIMQIVISILQNAKDSLIKSNWQTSPEIVIDIIPELEHNQVIIKFTDNGLGISPDNIKKIFTFGFTTKTEKQGFSLHNSAIMAKELGGDLQAESKGENLGATFTLKLVTNLKNYGS